jgi:hypothetical protein
VAAASWDTAASWETAAAALWNSDLAAL